MVYGRYNQHAMLIGFVGDEYLSLGIRIQRVDTIMSRYMEAYTQLRAR